MNIKTAPWTAEEVANLREYQKTDIVHPYTWDQESLIPTTDGWVRNIGGPVLQEWALEEHTQGKFQRELWPAPPKAPKADNKKLKAKLMRKLAKTVMAAYRKEGPSMDDVFDICGDIARLDTD